MSALDSPLEAAISDLTYGLLTAVTNIWAWVAVITAAVGIWRIRDLSSPPRRSREVSPLKSSSSPEKTAASPATVSAPAGREHLLPASPNTTLYFVLESEDSPKGKFSVYYKDGFDECDDDGEDEADGGEAALEREKLGWGCGEWEKTMVVRMGDMGWYKCQDLTVLDGSAVRLWDDRRRRISTLVVDGGLTW